MSIDIISAVYCADYFSTFEVEGTKGQKYFVTFHGGEGPAFCTCKAYQFSKTQECKHITMLWKKGCFWNPQWHDGGTREYKPIQCNTNTVTNEVCPACGGPVCAVRIAV